MTATSERFRVLAYGRMLGQAMTLEELESFKASIAANAAAGLCDLLESEFVVERRCVDGSWRVDHVVNGTDPELFSNPSRRVADES
jgi:hypothetical protein